jgi:hypothetical protein
MALMAVLGRAPLISSLFINLDISSLFSNISSLFINPPLQHTLHVRSR